MLGGHPRSVLVPLAVVFAFILGAWSTIDGVVSRWLAVDESYSHGFLLLAVSAYLVVQQWRVRPAVTLFSPFWLLPLLGFLLLYIGGSMLMIEAVQQFVLIPALLCALGVIWGWRELVRFLIPVGLLVFAIPFWDYLAWPLQLITTKVNEILLGLLGIEFHVDGVFVFLTGVGAFEVAHGCSGLRYFLVGLTLSVVYGQMNFTLWRNRIMLCVLSVVFALAANWIRVFVIIHQGYVTNMESPLVGNHEFFGWIVFALSLIPLFWMANRMERSDNATAKARVRAPEDIQDAEQAEFSRFSKVGIVFTLLMLLAPALALGVISTQSSQLIAGQKAPRLMTNADWAPYFQRNAVRWVPVIHGADNIEVQAYFLRKGLSEGRAPKAIAAIEVYTYLDQKPGKELVQDSNHPFDRERWSIKQSREQTVDHVDWTVLTIQSRQTNETITVAFSYLVGGRWLADPIKAKLAQISAAFAGQPDVHQVFVALDCEACASDNLLNSVLADTQKQTKIFVSRMFKPQ
ncbi:exosortase [Marinobacter sp. V034]|uniref:exosortase n=1 Tax=Marinobacter sp. V034 TaxID=3459610 RepID=UPI004044B10D